MISEQCAGNPTDPRFRDPYVPVHTKHVWISDLKYQNK